jgi:AraC-like DNA-binding protein
MNSRAEIVFPTPGYSFCFQTTRDRKLHYNWHHHIEYEFTVCRNGSGEARIGDIILPFAHPTAFFITPQTDHAFISEGQFDGWIVQIPPRIFEQYKGRPEFYFFTELTNRASPALGFSRQISEQIVTIMEKAQSQEGVFRWICLLQAFHFASLDTQARLFSFSAPCPEAGGESESLFPQLLRNQNIGDGLDKIVNYLFENYAGCHRLEDLASAAGMPLQSFCRQFKKRTGMTVIEYLHSVRINTAKKLLQQSNFYIDDICYEAGFNSVSFFNRKFKEHTGKTPIEYRRSFKEAL